MAKTTMRPKADPIPSELVKVRVTFKGDGKVSNGVHVSGLGDEFYEKGERFDVAADVAYELQDRGFVEIEGKAPPRPKKAPEPKTEPEKDGEWQG